MALVAPGSAVARTVSGRRVSSARTVAVSARLSGPVSRPAATGRAAPAQQQLATPARSSVVAKASGAGPAFAPEDEPETAKEAIELGNNLAKQGRWQDALAIYEKALTLPGTGLKRYRDKPRLISDGEKSAALFNIACAWAQLGEARNGLIALAGCLELGYDDFAQLRSDPDLAPLRKDERFEGLLKRFERPAAQMPAFLAGFFGNRK
ncbi:hypothetical protein HYH03_017121 [Edaphochlamys debaryana]|uniref:Uncharacterized protein n=1 Tax=Edaphochlamys debaryana TaxID=47281 RepID=A0A836BP73_9CHLO|nr:hypothetical protein HYH03_017121 [Edaphochlamys debaryana]|eukprot:KAG2484031.1 hypothetical protein HYH03_017121 [Edaphochlamys debaryana]